MSLSRRPMLLGLPVLALAACRPAPLQQGQGEFLTDATMAQRAIQIRRAGASLGWVIADAGPGRLRGTLDLRSHQAVVDIPYDRRRFSILYAGSTNLNVGNGMIHSNYNGWVRNLQNAIIRESGMG